jgi:hypothetical protein
LLLRKKMELWVFISFSFRLEEKIQFQIERVLPVAGEYQKQEFSYVLSKQAYHSISEDHLWFSIFSRPPSNKFTRVQRCTCCFVLLLMTMLLNILYYDQATDAKANTSNSIAFGPFYINSEQVCFINFNWSKCYFLCSSIDRYWCYCRNSFSCS